MAWLQPSGVKQADLFRSATADRDSHGCVYVCVSVCVCVCLYGWVRAGDTVTPVQQDHLPQGARLRPSAGTHSRSHTHIYSHWVHPSGWQKKHHLGRSRSNVQSLSLSLSLYLYLSLACLLTRSVSFSLIQSGDIMARLILLMP